MSAWYEPSAEDATKIAWLRKTDAAEELLEPGLPIIDPHHHLWDARAPLSCDMRPITDEGGEPSEGGAHCATGRPGHSVDPAHPGPGVPVWQKRYTMDDVASDVYGAGHNIVKTVFLECGAMFRADGPLELRCVGETEFVNGIASMARSGAYGPCEIAAGISGTADLSLGAAVEPVLRAHMVASPNFCGIRCPHDPSSAGWKEGMKVMEKLGLVYDIGCSHEGLEEVLQCAQAFPNVKMVLNHCGGTPGPAAFEGHPEIEAKWKEGMQKLAACPNMHLKVGGIQMSYNGLKDATGTLLENRRFAISSAELAQLTFDTYSFCINTFGPTKCMWESNFPVDKVTISYKVFWNSAKLVSAKMGLSDADKQALFHDTAAMVYGLSGAGGVKRDASHL